MTSTHLPPRVTPDERPLLVGDVGGTKSMLAFVVRRGARVELTNESIYPSRRYEGLAPLLAEYRARHGAPALAGACFSVAGPVRDGRTWFPNLRWELDEASLRVALGVADVRLVNDLQATAHAIAHRAPDQLHTLQEGTIDPRGVRAVIAVGTGLGEAMLVPDASGWRAWPSEGGHTDFAPTDPLQRDLLAFLAEELGQVSYERVCSGQGIFNIYRFLRATSGEPEPAWLTARLADAEDPTPVVVEAALSNTARCATCRRALETLAAILGGAAGNLALRTLATGGVYVGGGIPPRLLPVLREGAFLAAFRRKGVMSELVSRVPVHIILAPRTALLGAAHYALAMSE
ncbi:MAG TPA: glucokinase [Gemmatimonadaceae bacterium]|nr:glucokinase [Gemmatimonadaceae bacterium]